MKKTIVMVAILIMVITIGCSKKKTLTEPIEEPTKVIATATATDIIVVINTATATPTNITIVNTSTNTPIKTNTASPTITPTFTNTNLPTSTATATATATTVYINMATIFPDINLRNIIYTSMTKTASDNITQQDLNTITSLTIVYNSPDIYNLIGIKNLNALIHIYIIGVTTGIIDISELNIMPDSFYNNTTVIRLDNSILGSGSCAVISHLEIDNYPSWTNRVINKSGTTCY